MDRDFSTWDDRKVQEMEREREVMAAHTQHVSMPNASELYT